MNQDLKDLIEIALAKGRTVLAVVPDDDGYGNPVTHHVIGLASVGYNILSSFGCGRIRAFCEIRTVYVDGVLAYTNTEAI